MPTYLVVRALASIVAVSGVAAPVAATIAPTWRPAEAAPVATGHSDLPAPRPAAGIVPDPAAPVAWVAPEPLSARRVVLYGDSLASQSQQFFVAALAAAGVAKVTTRTFGGTAICDWLPQMRADAVALRPDAVVVEFSGNALTPCMRGLDGTPLGGPAYFQKYAADADAVLDIFAAGRGLVFFAGAPISRGAERAHDPGTPSLHAIYAALAQSSPFGRYADAGASVLADGRWTETLPCMPTEPCTGGRDGTGKPVNVVRAPDGAHFCPGAPAAVRGVTAACPVWSSGSWRFGTAMAAPVVAEFEARQG